MKTKEFRLIPVVAETDTLSSFLEAFSISGEDTVITDRCVLNDAQKAAFPCPIVYEDDFGRGEPTVERVGKVCRAVSHLRKCGRIIGIGGGSALDIAKAAALEIPADCAEDDIPAYIEEVFDQKIPAIRSRGLILIPTTCGTGSEVTNISVAMSEKLHVKRGLACSALYADSAVLIPELLASLPYPVLLSSSMDALIHAVESYLSPKAGSGSRLFSESAIRTILSVYEFIRDNGTDAASEKVGELLTAANQAGIAFSNAGCGQIHAMSYPIGAKYHIPHGESNHQLFLAVMEYYAEKNAEMPADSAFNGLCALFDSCFGGSDGYGQFRSLIAGIMKRRPLGEYGMTGVECADFAESVRSTQERLTKNAYIPVSVEDMRKIYESLL